MSAGKDPSSPQLDTPVMELAHANKDGVAATNGAQNRDADPNITAPIVDNGSADGIGSMRGISSGKAHWHALKAGVHAVGAVHHIREGAQMVGSIHPTAWRETTVGSNRSPDMVIGEPVCCYMNPDHTWSPVWDAVIIALLLYTIIFLPWRLAFLEANYDAVDVVVDTLFLLDIIITFFRAYEDEQGRLVVDHKLIAARYVKSWFILDLVATFPFYFFFESSASRATTLVRIPRLLKLFRLLRLLKLFRANALVDTVDHVKDSSDFHPGLFRLLKLLVVIISVVHVFACIWIFLPQVPWEDENTGWLLHFRLAGLSEWDQYCIAIYFICASLTSTGYGDYFSTNNTERVYACIVMLAGVAVLAYTTATLTSVFRSLDLEATQYRVHMEKLASFMKHCKLDHGLQGRMRKHFKLLWSKPPLSFDAQSILSSTPKDLRAEVVRAVHKGLITSTPLLHTAEEDFVTECLIDLQPVKLDKGDIIAKQGRPVNMWYIIVTGSVEFISHITGAPLLSLRTGASFGEIGLLLTGTWLTNVVCGTSCRLMSLNKRQILRLLDAFSKTREKLMRLAQLRMQRLSGQFQRQLMASVSMKGSGRTRRGLSTVAFIEQALERAKAEDAGEATNPHAATATVPRFTGAVKSSLSNVLRPPVIPFDIERSDSEHMMEHKVAAGYDDEYGLHGDHDERNSGTIALDNTTGVLPGAVFAHQQSTGQGQRPHADSDASADGAILAAAMRRSVDSMASMDLRSSSVAHIPGLNHSMTQHAFDEAVPHAHAANAEHTHSTLIALQARMQGLELLLSAVAEKVNVSAEVLEQAKSATALEAVGAALHPLVQDMSSEEPQQLQPIPPADTAD